MIPLSLQEIACALDATLLGEDRLVDAVTTDSRQIAPGALFVAIKGERFDAHQFCADVVAKGAGALLVSEPQPLACPQLLVNDTRYALGQLGALVRSRLHPKVVAITGSCGKTTVKEMCAAILALRGSVLATQGNLNNEIGVPLTLLRLTPEHAFAVMELGANHPGEIAWTTSLVKPDVALINNVAAAHLEGFGSLQGVALAKSEIFTGLSEQGMAIVNADSEFFGFWQADLEPNMHSFGIENSAADFFARDIRSDEQARCSFTMVTPVGEVDISLPLPGRHNVANALAAAALAQALDTSLMTIKRGLESLQPVKGRLCLKELPGLTLIDDTYNASVQSVFAAIDTLAALPGFRVLVFGDMGELGQEAEALHREVGAHAKAAGLDAVFTVGLLAEQAAKAAGGVHFSDKTALFAALTPLLSQHPHLTLLAKGARSSRMEEVIEFVKNSKEQAC
ncbi:MAG: UDP-N-acetylmuramoyl-tripeptide--D-alanyl-D-alanine ligase [Aeromonadaceae bacterium]